MITETDIPLEERIFQLLQHLGIERAHFAARIPSDWQAVLAAYPKSVASLTLLCPQRVETRSLLVLASRLLVVTGGQGHDAYLLRSNLEGLPDATVVTLQDYLAGNATDVAADRRDDISNAMLGFLAGIDREQNVQRASLPEGEGQVAGLLYRIQGAGPPLVLLPLQYSPSQWDPLLDQLSQNYSTITLSGANVGAVFSLETRARGGYLEVVQDVAMSFTATQYVDADRMLREMMRVTRPGGRVAVLARGDDRPNLVNVPLRAELKAKVEGERTERYNELGCNDASLYRRFHQAGLSKVRMFPQLAIFTPSTDGAVYKTCRTAFYQCSVRGKQKSFIMPSPEPRRMEATSSPNGSTVRWVLFLGELLESGSVAVPN